MKVLALNSSARTGGESKTEIMLNCLVEGMREAEADVEVVDLRNKKINNCAGCFSCWTKTPGTCIHKDDMTRELFPEWLESDLVVFESNKEDAARRLVSLKCDLILLDNGAAPGVQPDVESGDRDCVVAAAPIGTRTRRLASGTGAARIGRGPLPRHRHHRRAQARSRHAVGSHSRAARSVRDAGASVALAGAGAHRPPGTARARR